MKDVLLTMAKMTPIEILIDILSDSIKEYKETILIHGTTSAQANELRKKIGLNATLVSMSIGMEGKDLIDVIKETDLAMKGRDMLRPTGN